ncbi:MAG TPA: ABC transporter permease [Gemmatimonadaceae bacterium]|nr:ABC transporter permease [Gemmatimonadaceae bacterium]
MGKTWTVFVREYVERVRSKWFIIGTIFGPLLFGAIMILPAVLGARTKASRDVSNVVVLDATGTDLGRRVADRLSGGLQGDTALARVVPVAPPALAEAESTATRQVMAKEIQGYFVLDSATLAGRSARYAGRNASSISDLDQLRTAARQAVLAYRLETAGLDVDRVQSLTDMRLSLDAERITDEGRGGSGIANTIFGMLVAVLLYFSIFLYGINVMRGVQEEKQTRVAEVVLSSAPADALLGGKVLGIGAVGLTQMVIWVAAAAALAKWRGAILGAFGVPALSIPLPSISAGAVVLLLLFFVLGYLLYASLFAAVGSMVNSDQDAQTAAQPVIMLLVASVLFLQPVMQNPSSRLAEIVSWIPFTAPVMMPMRMTLVAIPPLELGAVLVGIAATVAVVIWLAARIYRVGLLMYGKRPSLGELARWVRRA